MARARSKDASIPTQKKWAMTYAAALPAMVDAGRVKEKHARMLVKGYKYIEKVCDLSLKEYREGQKENLRSNYEEAKRRFG